MQIDPIEACATQVERADPDRFLAAMAAPLTARKILLPLYAFNAEIARAPWVTNEPVIAQMRLQFWRDILADIGSGTAPRSHEVATPLSGFLDEDSVALLDQLIVARHWDIHRDPFETEQDFIAYIEQTSGNLMLVAARALGTAETEAVVDFAYGSGIANWLRAIPALEAAGRVPLVDGRPEAIRALADNALLRLKRGQKNRTKISKPSRAALLSGWQSEVILKQAIAAPNRVANGALGQSEFARRMSLLIKSSLGRG